MDLKLACCPHCQEVIDSTSTACRFCAAALDPAKMEQAAAAFRSSVDARSKINDSLATRAAVVGLIGLVASGAFYFYTKIEGSGARVRRQDIAKVAQLVRQKDFRSAIAGAKYFLESDPNNPELHLILGSALLASGDTPEALPEFLMTEQLDPGNPDAALLLGTYYYDREVYENADRWLTQAVDGKRYDGMVVRLRGFARFMMSRTDEAMADFESAARLNPKAYPVPCSLGMAHARKGERDPAIRSYEECVRQAPDNPAYAKSLAELRSEVKKP